MTGQTLKDITIRPIRPEEYDTLGRMTQDIYEALPGMPDRDEQPAYYAMLLDVKTRVEKPSTEVLVAPGADNQILGGVTFVGDMAFYASGGTASEVKNSSGIRLLAVRPDARGKGVGRALTLACIEKAVRAGKSRVILHTTRSMEVAWKLYEHMGFNRSEDLNFMQGTLPVFGFSLRFDRIRIKDI